MSVGIGVRLGLLVSGSGCMVDLWVSGCVGLGVRLGVWLAVW